MSGPGGRLLVLLALIVIAYAGAQWWQQRQSSGPERPAMASAVVVGQKPVADGRVTLTVRFRAGGRAREISRTVPRSDFRAQGGTAWVCFDPGDATDARVRLPQDPLCGQK